MESFEEGKMSKEELALNIAYGGTAHSIEEGRIPSMTQIDELVEAAFVFGMAEGIERGMKEGTEVIIKHLRENRA